MAGHSSFLINPLPQLLPVLPMYLELVGAGLFQQWLCWTLETTHLWRSKKKDVKNMLLVLLLVLFVFAFCCCCPCHCCHCYGSASTFQQGHSWVNLIAQEYTKHNQHNPKEKNCSRLTVGLRIPTDAPATGDCCTLKVDRSRCACLIHVFENKTQWMQIPTLE